VVQTDRFEGNNRLLEGCKGKLLRGTRSWGYQEWEDKNEKAIGLKEETAMFDQKGAEKLQSELEMVPHDCYIWDYQLLEKQPYHSLKLLDKRQGHKRHA